MRYCFLLILFTHVIAKGQSFDKYPSNYFGQPLAGEMQIIGTFCELRPNHFHGGIDIRTNGEIGKPILSIADGYISRINISSYGYGKALYITHPNGYTSVYGHLSDFPPSIKWYIQKNQILLKKWDIELYPDVDLLQVKKGELVAYSGNTGGSQGPHLHFEIRDTKTEEPINPLLFGYKMRDFMAPEISNVFLYYFDTLTKSYNGQHPSMRLNMYQYNKIKTKRGVKKVKVKQTHFNLAYGKYALGVVARDFATSRGDNNGVNYLEVYKDAKRIYQCKIERFNFSKNRMYNNYIDYRRFKISGEKMHKLFKDVGTTFDFYQGNGWFDVNDTVPFRLTFSVSDIYGNKSEHSVIITGNPSMSPPKDYLSYSKPTQYFLPNIENEIKIKDAFKVRIPANSLYHASRLSIYQLSSNTYVIGDDKIALDKRIEISFKLNNEQIPLAHKYVVKGTGKPLPTLFQNGWLKAEAKEFGTYTYILDETPPTIQALSINRNGYFSFRVSDNLSGIAHFDFYIDSQWLPLDYEYKNSLIYGYIPHPISSGYHIIKLVVCDERKNCKTYIKDIEIK